MAELSRRRVRWQLVGVLACLVTATAVAVVIARENQDPPTSPSPRGPEVVLGRGTFAGKPWVYGMSHFDGGKPCLQLVMDGGGCGTYHANKDRHLRFFTGSAGNPDGTRTAQGLLSPKVADVVTLSGGRPVGEVHVFDLPERTGGDTRSFVAFVDESDLEGAWVAIAYDRHSRQIGRQVLFDL